MLNIKPALLTWLTCLLLLAACGPETIIPPTPTLTPGPVTISASINSDGQTTLSGADFQLVGTKGLGVGWWELGFAATLYTAKEKQNTLFVLYQAGNGEVVQQEFAIGRPFDIHFNPVQWVKKLERDANGNAVIYVEPTPGSSTQSAASSTATTVSPFPTAGLPTPTAGLPVPTAASSTPTAVATMPEPTSTPEVMLTPDLDLSDPVEFINFYFGNINARNYPLTWSLLSSHFIDTMNSPAQGGYQGYVDYWNTARQVYILNVAVENQDAASARVNVFMSVDYVDGRSISWHQHFTLIYEPARNTWLFDG
jgi:hypothetical protein